MTTIARQRHRADVERCRLSELELAPARQGEGYPASARKWVTWKVMLEGAKLQRAAIT